MGYKAAHVICYLGYGCKAPGRGMAWTFTLFVSPETQLLRPVQGEGYNDRKPEYLCWIILDQVQNVLQK